MKTDRFLTAIVVGIVLLVILALALFINRGSNQEYDPANTPSAVINNYTLAVYRGDYEKAYSYLAEAEKKPDYSTFRRAFLSDLQYAHQVSLLVANEQIDGDHALVSVTILHPERGLFADANRETAYADLIRQNGEWKLLFLPYPFMNWGWYQTTPELNKPYY